MAAPAREPLQAKFQKLTQTQQSIETVSSLCIFYHKDARTVVSVWEEEFYKAPHERRMALLYLANHVLQEGRKKGTGFQDEFFKVLPKALSHVLAGADDTSRRALTRLVGIWEERRVFGTRHIKSFQSLLGSSGGSSGRPAAAAAPGGSSGSGGYQPSRRAAGGSGGSSGTAGEEVATAAKLAAAAAEKRKLFDAAWKPEVVISGDLSTATTVSGHLEAYEAALKQELTARRAAAAALQAAARAQEDGVAAALAQLGAVGAQREQLTARVKQLSAGLVAGLQALSALPGAPATVAATVPVSAAAGNGAVAAPPPAAAGSPEAPDMELEDLDYDGSGLAAPAAAAAVQPSGLPPPAGPPPPQAAGSGLFADALSGLPDAERDRFKQELQQLMSSGLLAGAPVASGGTGFDTGAFADEGDDPYNLDDSGF